MNLTSAPRFNPQPSTLNPQPVLRKKPILVKGCPLPIYKTRWTSKATRRSYTSYVIVWRDSTGRRREKHADLEKAKDRVQKIWINVLNGQTIQNRWSEEDRAEYLYLKRESARLGIPLLRLLEDYKAGQEIARGRFTFAQAAAFYEEHQPKEIEPKHIPEIIQDLLATKRAQKKSDKWLGTLAQQLEKFGARFNCPFHTLQAREIDTWLDGLKCPGGSPVGIRTRKNYFSAIQETVRFAKSKGYLARTWSELDHVEAIEPPPVDVKIPTPDHLLKILIARQNIEDRARSGATLIPFLALQAFAGIRHEEMHQRGDRKPVLDWSCIDLDQGIIKIAATVGKTKKRRLILIHPNLKEWLTPYAKRSGPVCELSQVAGAIDRAKKLAGVPSARGELKNAFRKGFISYRVAETNDIGLTALEAGNSVKIIQENYRELATAAEAERWFGISPARAEILPLFAWAKDAS